MTKPPNAVILSVSEKSHVFSFNIKKTLKEENLKAFGFRMTAKSKIISKHTPYDIKKFKNSLL
jgi:cytochrome c556